jgi:hypothetical protein
LAGEADETIAAYLGLTRRTVTTFIAMNFDVRPRIKAGPWIRRVAIGLPLGQAPSVETLMLIHAWKRGPTVIGPWLDFLKHRGERHDLNTDLGRQRAWLAHLIQVQQLPFEAQCLRSLWRLTPFILGKPLEVTKSTTVAAAISQIRDRVLAEITWKEPDDQVLSEGNLPAVGEEVVSQGKERRLAQAG